MNDFETVKRMIEDMVLEQLLDSFPIITGRTPTDEWDHVEKVEGSPDHIIGLNGKTFGIELAEIRDADAARRRLLAHPGKDAHRERRPLTVPKRTLERCPSLPL